jgi:hypothetical protein
MKHNHLQHLLATIALLLVAGASPALHGQTDYSSRKATSRLGIGVGASIGVAVPISGDLPDSVEAAPGFAFRGGLNITYPITHTIGVFFNTGIDTRGVGKKIAGEADNRVYSATYFFLEPGISLSAFKVSVNIGLPSAFSFPEKEAFSPATGDLKELMETMIEPRLGGTLVLVDQKEWWLGLNVDIGMTLNTLFKEEYISPLFDNDVPAMKMFSGHFGLTWQFGVPGTGGL